MHEWRLVSEVFSNMGYLILAMIEYYYKRTDIAVGWAFIFFTSESYHLCNTTDGVVCINTFVEHGAADYGVNFLFALLIVRRLVHFNLQTFFPIYVFSSMLAVFMFPRLYTTYISFLLGPIALMILQILRITFGLPPMYRSKWIGITIFALGIIALGLVLYPIDIYNVYYEWLHIPWHLITQLTGLMYTLLMNRVCTLRLSPSMPK